MCIRGLILLSTLQPPRRSCSSNFSPLAGRGQRVGRALPRRIWHSRIGFHHEQKLRLHRDLANHQTQSFTRSTSHQLAIPQINSTLFGRSPGTPGVVPIRCPIEMRR